MRKPKLANARSIERVINDIRKARLAHIENISINIRELKLRRIICYSLIGEGNVV